MQKTSSSSSVGKTLYHRRVLVAPRANKESIDVLLRDELERDAVVDQEDEPKLVLLLDAISVLVGGDAVDASPGKKAQPKSTATTKFLQIPWVSLTISPGVGVRSMQIARKASCGAIAGWRADPGRARRERWMR